MHYGILGTTQAHLGDGTPVAIGGARLRSLLTALALRPGQVRSPGALIDEVWPEDPPQDAPAAVQALVGRLRRVLGKDAVLSAPGGYRLAADPDSVDLYRFERLVDEGTRALADGDPDKAAALMDDALALWRGPALADLPDRTAPAARAEARRLAARRTRAEAALALGHAEQVLPTLTELCAAHPLDEPLHALRIRALSAVGRTAEALAAYEEIRAEIADRLGSDPGPVLRGLHAGLLEPVPVPAAGPDAPRRERAPGNLRARLTSFVGRESDLDALRGDLAAQRLVTLLGPGGAGKTRLSLEAAEAVAADWPDGVWLAELAPVDDPGTVPEAVLTALGARETVVRGSAAEGLATSTDPLGRLAEHCGPRRMLLVMDNCEHVVDAAARLAEFLLARCPGVTVLATSREPLAVPGELVRPVEPLPDPVALRLLGDRGAAARPGFSTEDDPAACAEICRRLDGLPLAIELAAARLRLLTPRQIADRLDDRFRLLTSGSRTVLPRQQTLRAVVDWSWGLLTEEERTVLRRLSVFAGGCDLPLAEEVCGDPPAATPPAATPPAADRPTATPPTANPLTTDGPATAPWTDSRDIAALLGSLIDKSLVVAAPAADGGMRYRLLETVAEYASERLEESGERAPVERRHLVAFRELARTADPELRGPGQLGWLDRLEREHDNLRTALRRAVATGQEQEGLCLVLSLGWFWHLRGHRQDARQWARAVADVGPDPFQEPVEPVPPLYARPVDEPPPMPPEQLAEARRQVRLVGLANLEGDMQVVDTPEMQRELEALVSAYRPGLPQTCRVPGAMWYVAIMLTGDFVRMGEAVEKAVETARELGYEWELAYCLHLRARMLNDRSGGEDGRNPEADEALEIFTRLGDAWGAAEALAGRGETAEQRGDFDAAAADYRAAIGLAEKLGTHAVTLLRCRLAGALIESGDEEAAERGEATLREVVEEGHRNGSETVSYARLYLAMRCGTRGRTAEAREHLQELFVEFGSRALELFQGLVEGLMAWLDVLDGVPDAALEKIRGALEKTRGPLTMVVAPHMPVVQVLTAARALALSGGRERALTAARLLGAYDALRPGRFYVPEMEREGRRKAEEDVRAVLDDPAYRREHGEGAGLSLEEAVALV